MGDLTRSPSSEPTCNKLRDYDCVCITRALKDLFRHNILDRLIISDTCVARSAPKIQIVRINLLTGGPPVVPHRPRGVAYERGVADERGVTDERGVHR